jgi:tight adherence protein C
MTTAPGAMRARVTVADVASCAVPMLLGLLAAGALGLFAGAFAGLAVARFVRARRHRLQEEAGDAALLGDLPDALDLVAAALQSGAPTTRAFAVVATHLGGPLGPILRTAVRRAEEPVGPTLSEAIRSARPRVLRPLAACLSASEELGTPLAPALRVLARDERERRRVAIRIQIARVSPRVTLVVSTVLAPASLILIVGAQALTMIDTLRS